MRSISPKQQIEILFDYNRLSSVQDKEDITSTFRFCNDGLLTVYYYYCLTFIFTTIDIFQSACIIVWENDKQKASRRTYRQQINYSIMAISKLFLQIFVSLFFKSSLNVTASSEASVSCSSPIELESGVIPNSPLTSSSSYSDGFRAENSRFSFLGAWKPKENDSSPWLQIKLNTIENITQVGTRGRYDADEWVNTFSVSYSIDGDSFTFYENKVFSGNQDRNSIVINVFPSGLRAQYVRIYPKTHTGATAMRVELYKLYSCAKTCVLGMENRNVSDSQVTSSTRRNLFSSAWRARLNLKRHGLFKGAWSSRYQDSHQWLQVIFEKVVTVTRIATQGRQDLEEWVTTYSVSFNVFSNNSLFIPYRQGKNLTGNQDKNTVVVNVLMPHITLERIRIHPTSWYGRISMRVEFYKCKEVLVSTEQSTVEIRSAGKKKGKTTTKRPRTNPKTEPTTSSASSTSTTEAKTHLSSTSQPKTQRSSTMQQETQQTTPTLNDSNVSDTRKGSQQYSSQQYEYRRPDDVTIAASVTAAQLAIASFILMMYILNKRRMLERTYVQDKPTGHVANGVTLDNRPASTLSTDSHRMDHFYQSLLTKDKEGRTWSRKYQGLTTSYQRESSDTTNKPDVYSYAATDICVPPAKRNSDVVLSKPFLTSGNAHGAHDNPGWVNKENKDEVQQDLVLEPVYESVDRALKLKSSSEESSTQEPSYDIVEGPDPEIPESNVYNVLEGPDPDVDPDDEQSHIYAAVDNGEVVSDDENSCDRTYDDLEQFRTNTEQQGSTEETANRRLSIAI